MNLQNDKRIQRVLMSVSDKTYLEDLARVFVQLGIEIIATGGTASFLKKVNIQNAKKIPDQSGILYQYNYLALLPQTIFFK